MKRLPYFPSATMHDVVTVVREVQERMRRISLPERLVEEPQRVIRGLSAIAQYLRPDRPPTDKTVRRYIRDDGLPARKLACGEWVVKECELQKWKEMRKIGKKR
jgi:hypothetical protein